MSDKIKLFRRVQTIISTLIFIGIFLMCWYVTGFSLVNIQLSFWGISKLGWIWNSCLILLSISIFINVYYFIEHHQRLNTNYNSFLKYLFLLTSVFLFITGLVNMTYALHNVVAYLYFFSYPLCIFLFSHLNRKSLKYRDWQIHTLFSSLMIILPVLSIKLFPGMAISETLHSVMVIGWNLWILLD